MLNLRRIVGLPVDVLRGIKPQNIRNKRVSYFSTKEADLPKEQPNPDLSQSQKEEEHVPQAVKYVFLKPPPRIFSSSIKAGNPIQPAASEVGDQAAEKGKDMQSTSETDQSSSAAQQ